MKLLLSLALLVASAPALAGSLAPLTDAQSKALVAHCQCVMDSGLCAIESRRPMASRPVRYGDRFVQPADENFLTEAGPAMCSAAEKELAKDSTSDRALVIRRRWRADFTVCPYPIVKATK